MKHVEKDITNWDMYLQSAAFAVKNSVSTATGFTPSELIMGRKLKSPVDFIIGSNTGNGSFHEKQSKQFINKLMTKLKDNANVARSNLMKSRSSQKKQYDKSVKGVTISPHDIVMLWYPYHKRGISKCFVPKWNGPWLVVKFTSPWNCHIVNEKR